MVLATSHQSSQVLHYHKLHKCAKDKTIFFFIIHIKLVFVSLKPVTIMCVCVCVCVHMYTILSISLCGCRRASVQCVKCSPYSNVTEGGWGWGGGCIKSLPEAAMAT